MALTQYPFQIPRAGLEIAPIAGLASINVNGRVHNSQLYKWAKRFILANGIKLLLFLGTNSLANAQELCKSAVVCKTSLNNQLLLVSEAGALGIENLGYTGISIDISGLGVVDGSQEGIYQPDGFSFKTGEPIVPWRSVINLVENKGQISGSENGIYNGPNQTLLVLNNSGSIIGIKENAVWNSGYIHQITNQSGSALSGETGIYNSPSATIDYLRNFGSIVAGSTVGFGIYNSGNIGTVENLQGGTILGGIRNSGSIGLLLNNGVILGDIAGGNNLIVAGTGDIGSLSNYSFIYGDPGYKLLFQSAVQNLYSYSLPAVDVDSQSTITFEWPILFSLSPDMLSGSGNIVLQNTETSSRPEKYFVIDQGRSTFSGSIVVNNGISVSLERNSDIGNAASLSIRSGSFVAGSGRLPSTLISSDARISPSDFECNEFAELSCSGWERLPGRIQIAGNLSLSPGSTTELSIFRVSSDILAVDGRASLSGTLQLDFPDNFYESSYLYDLLTASSISGEYELVTGILPGHAYDVIYKPGSVQLSLFKAITPGESTNASDPASNVINGGSLIVDSSGSYATDYIITPLGATINTGGSQSTFSGIFSGPGSLIISNTASGGSISLTGLNTYTGSTTVGNNVTLFVNGSIATSSGLIVNSGGNIGGNGQLPATTIASGGIMAPGNSIGTLTVNGNYSLNDGTLAIELQGPTNDQIVVTGNVAPFTGTASLISFGGGTVWPGFTYSILTANASAPFATPSSLTLDQTQITPSALLQLGTTLIQDADGNPQTFDVQWRPTNSAGATTSAMQLLGQTGANQMATAGALDRVFQSLATNSANNSNNTGVLIGSTGFTSGQASASGISSDFLSVTSQLLNLSSGSQLTSAINSLSPEPYAAFQSVGLDTLKRQRELLMSHAGNCVHTGWIVNTSTNKKRNSLKNPLCMFAQVANATSSISGSGGLSSYDSGIFSSFYGIEYQPSTHWTIGASYGYGTSRLNNMALSSSSVTSAVNSGSIYGVYKPTERWTLRSLFGYANFNSTGRRNVSFVGNGSTIQGSPTGNGFTLAINADYLVNLTSASAQTQAYFKPIVGIAWGSYQQDGFGESAGGPLNLDVQGNTANSLVGTIGFELATSPIPLNKNNTIAIRPRLAVAYQVDALGNDTGAKSLTSSFQSAPAAGTSVTQGENMGVNALLVDGGFDITLSNSASIYANVGYEVTSNGSQLTYGGGMKVRF